MNEKVIDIAILYSDGRADETFKNVSKFLKEDHGISFSFENNRIFITYHALTAYIMYEEEIKNGEI